MYSFKKKFLGAVNDATYMTLEAWVSMCLPGDETHDLILQMDIEGSEYDVILETPPSIWERFRIIVIEFHALHVAFNPQGNRLLRGCFRKLARHFDIVHLHPNNVAGTLKRNGVEMPSVMEVTLLRKDRVGSRKNATAFPHPLDRRNRPNKPDLYLPTCFYA